MNETQPLYRSMIVEYWDLLRGDTSQWSSRPYFLQIIRDSGEPALDVACGTGRILLDYLQEGIDIDGVDISPEMIEQCRQKAVEVSLRPNLYVQAMQTLDLPRRYRTIIVPSSSFQHLTDRADAREALRRFYAHLLPGGRLAMSARVFIPEPDDGEWALVAEAVRPSDGATVKHWFRCTFDVPNRLQHTEDRYEVVRDGEIIETESYVSSPCLTWYTVSEALDLLREAGFGDVEAHADFRFEPASDADTRYIVLGSRS